MSNAEERLKQWISLDVGSQNPYLEVDKDGRYWFNDTLQNKDIEEILQMLCGARKELKKIIDEENIKIKNHKGSVKSTNYQVSINKRMICYDLLKMLGEEHI